MAPTLRRTPRTGSGYIEPLLEIPNALPLHMVLVPGGTFMMGSPEDEPDRLGREDPQHEVTVPAFFMSRYPVTQAQWKVVAELETVERSLKSEPSYFKGENRPVEQVSWYEAVEFCNRLDSLTKRPYRLPSEAEWEYACRAGTTTPYYFGETITNDVANYVGEETTPVDHFGIANAFGLSDMYGNVFEWCQDHWHDSYKGAPTDGSAWLSKNESAGRIRRGGSWKHYPRICRSAYRNNDSPKSLSSNLGFRVVCSAPRPLQ
ncbi:formylglycine-generating enzyme family protein [Acaryochloris marina]|uniref:Sulfatase-modifying factor enzyme-like domain-containing protein n=1 Tax=Acaryochloris marina (strain MBIC 11017) TaxID=329726 RepID=A8ZLF6_ACAM1|nr:formylglycine-generating enzyme family protein [Acaryochloris marina]ABW31983.1 conserved hypothetical protein [Acaryochloris marina MBIC11017]